MIFPPKWISASYTTMNEQNTSIWKFPWLPRTSLLFSTFYFPLDSRAAVAKILFYESAAPSINLFEWSQNTKVMQM